jgi:antirestriction protein ArdC
MKQQDIYEQVTNRIIARLEQKAANYIFNSQGKA